MSGQAALGEGILNSDDVERHPLRNVITKAVGARDAIDLDVLEHDLEPGDLVMLCSDGLHGMVSDQEIASRFQQLVTWVETGTKPTQ